MEGWLEGWIKDGQTFRTLMANAGGPKRKKHIKSKLTDFDKIKSFD